MEKERKQLKRTRIGKIWLLAFLGVSSVSAETLTLQTAIEKTLGHHPDIKAFMLRIEQAERGYDAAFADYLPQVSVSANYTPTRTYVFPTNGQFHTVDDDGWDAGASVRQKVWDFAKTNALIDASKVDEDISRLSLAEAKALLAFKVKSLYELLVVQREAITVREKDLEAKKAFYAQSKALVKQGLKTEADASRFLSAVYLAEDSLAVAKASYEKAKVSLSLYMGVELPDDLQLQDDILKQEPDGHGDIENEVLAENTRLRIDRRTEEKNRRLHRASKNAHYGSIDLQASYTRIATLNDYDSHYVGISYNLPLYSGGRLSAQEQRSRIGYEIARQQSALEELAIKDELRSLLIDIDRYGKTIEAKKAQYDAAQKTRSVLEARYKEGLATYIELLDSTSVALNAKLGLLEAYYLRSIAIERIDYLKGQIQ